MSLAADGSSDLALLGQACDINPAKPKLDGVADGTPVLFVPMAAVDELTGSIAKPEERTLGELRKKSYRCFAPGDVLFAKITPCMENGKSAIVPPIDSAIGFGSTEFHVLRPRLGTNARYIWHLVRQQTFRDVAEEQMTGSVGQARVPASFLEEFPLALPDEHTQEKVADLLDVAVSRTSHVAARLFRARAVLRRLRTATLAAACSGRLTDEWRAARPEGFLSPKLIVRSTPSKKLRRGVDPSIPPSDIMATDLPPGWTTMTVAQLLAVDALHDVKDGNHGANHPKVSEFTEDGLPFITANCVRDGVIDYDDAPRVSGTALKRLKVGFSQPGDVVLTHKGSVGRVAVATEHAVLTPQTTYYRCDGTSLSPQYLALFFSSLYFYLQLAGVMSQTTRDFVPISEQYRLTVLVPPFDEQLEIVRVAGRLLGVAHQIEDRVRAAELAAGGTADAVAGKAFRGGLTFVEPERQA